MRLSLLIAVLVGSAGPTLAQGPGGARLSTRGTTTTAVDLFGADAPQPTPPVAPAGDVSAEHPAWRFYHLAFQSLAAGRRAEAIEQLRHVERSYGGHPLAARAREILRRLTESEPTDSTESMSGLPRAYGDGRDGGPSAFARAELVVGQTIHGVGLGLELCFLAECDDSRAIGASMVVGGGAGLGLSLLLTGDGITPGHAALLNSGTAWGAGVGFLTAGTINPSADDVRVIPAAMMAGQLAGLGVGHLLWRATEASAGDVALVNSSGLWLDFLTLMTALTIANGDVDGPEVIFGSILAGSVVGLGVGALVADRFPMSRGRVLVIDGGAAVGTLVGLGTALIIQSDEPAPYFLLPAVGAVGGLVLTTYLTRRWDVPETDVALMPAFGIAPWGDGVMFNAQMSW